MTEYKTNVGNKFYVYGHRDSEGKLFYIGKGCGNRAYETENRSFEWSMIADRGMTVEFIFTNLEEEDAVIREQALIVAYGCEGDGRGLLVNKLSSGHYVRYKADYTRHKDTDKTEEVARRIIYAKKHLKRHQFNKIVIVSKDALGAARFWKTLKNSTVPAGYKSPYKRAVFFHVNISRNYLYQLTAEHGSIPVLNQRVRFNKPMYSGQKIVITTKRQYSHSAFSDFVLVELYSENSVNAFLTNPLFDVPSCSMKGCECDLPKESTYATKA